MDSRPLSSRNLIRIPEPIKKPPILDPIGRRGGMLLLPRGYEPTIIWLGV